MSKRYQKDGYTNVNKINSGERLLLALTLGVLFVYVLLAVALFIGLLAVVKIGIEYLLA